MRWGKVALKFLKGILTGGLASVAVNPGDVAEPETAGVAMLVGLANAILNIFKHYKK